MEQYCPKPAASHLPPSPAPLRCRFGGSEARGVRLAGPWDLLSPSADEESFPSLLCLNVKRQRSPLGPRTTGSPAAAAEPQSGVAQHGSAPTRP